MHHRFSSGCVLSAKAATLMAISHIRHYTVFLVHVTHSFGLPLSIWCRFSVINLFPLASTIELSSGSKSSIILVLSCSVSKPYCGRRQQRMKLKGHMHQRGGSMHEIASCRDSVMSFMDKGPVTRQEIVRLRAKPA